jgi:hypothetical protein
VRDPFAPLRARLRRKAAAAAGATGGRKSFEDLYGLSYRALQAIAIL